MPKNKMTAAIRAKEFQNCGLDSKNGKLWCSACNREVDFTAKTVVKNHVNSVTHQKNKASFDQTLVQQPTLHTTLQKKDQWNELVEAMVSLGIPLHVLRQESKLREWISKYTKNGSTFPSLTILRDNLKLIGIKDVNETTRLLKEKDIVIMVDETIDVKNRKILNILAKPLERNQRFRLIYSKPVPECNAQVVAKAVDSALAQHFIDKQNLQVFISDNTNYMLLAGVKLKALSERLVHSTCWAHILHLVAEELRATMVNADKFISAMKAALVKSPARRSKLLSSLRALGYAEKLPPVPVITRWTTWVSAANYYWENFAAVLDFINNTTGDSAAMINLKGMTEDEELACQLESLSKISQGLNSSILELQNDNTPACAVWVNVKVIEELLKCCGLDSTKLQLYLYQKHPALKFWQEVQVFDPRKAKAMIHNHNLPESVTAFLHEPVPMHEVVKYEMLISSTDLQSNSSFPFQFWELHRSDLPTLSALALKCLTVPGSSASVERSFSQLKRVYTRMRTQMTDENLEYHLKIMFNNVNKYTSESENNFEMEGEDEDD